MFRTGVFYVRVDAQVVDGKRLVAALDKDDFVVWDEDEPQRIAYFGRESEPLWVLLLIDVSGSMKHYLDGMAGVARRALAGLGQADHVAVMFFGRETRIAQGFTAEKENAAPAIGEAIRERGVGAGTAINPAILDAARYVRENVANQPGRRAIVILTDNEGLNYQVTDEMTLAALNAADIVFNAIVTPKSKPPEKRPGYTNPDFSPADVFKLARETGGEVLRADRAGESFREMLERIRTRYSLHYRAPEGTAGQVRRIRVDLRPDTRKRYPRAQVRARSGYAVPN